MTTDAVLFDCDGVLVDSEVVGLEDSAEYLKTHGFDFSPEDLIRRFTGKRDDRFRAEMISHYADILGRTPTAAEGAALVDGLIDVRRSQRHTMQPVEGARDTLKLLSGTKLRVAVASSSKQEHLDSKIERYDLAPFVAPHVYSADRVSAGKPAPDIFLYAAEKLEIAPENCLVIEDSAFGVEAGVAAGMKVWGFTGGGHCFGNHDQRLRDAGAVAVPTSHVALQQMFTLVIEEHSKKNTLYGKAPRG